MADIIIVCILVCIVAAIVRYLYKARKRGEKCIGCPNAGQCGSCKDNGQNCHK